MLDCGQRLTSIMNTKPLTALFLLSILFLGCQPKSSDSADTTAVDLASDETTESSAYEAQELEASFMSDRQSFSYALTYDGNKMQIVDGQFDGATVVGPSFSVEGGAQIIVKTSTSSELQDFIEKAGAAVEMNGLTMYHSSSTVGSCAVDTTVVPVSVESLEFTLKVCDGQDSMVGQRAMYDLLNGLEIKAL